MAHRFRDKVVVITGGSAGIGEAAAERFANEGAKLVLAARRLEPLEEVAQRLRVRGAEVLTVAGDMASVEDCRALIEKSVEAFGGIDVLVNNAGAHSRGEFDKHPAEAFALMVDVNLRAPIVLTRFALGHLKRSRGAVVHVASLAGRVPLPEAAVYSATKFGLRAFSLALHEEMRGSGVRHTVVSPGPVETSFILGDLDEVSPLAVSQPMSTAEQIAEAVLDCAYDGEPERAMPRISGALTTFAYLFPRAGRLLRPVMAWRGERAKARIRAKQEAQGGR